jgi:hypothetical protein
MRDISTPVENSQYPNRKHANNPNLLRNGQIQLEQRRQREKHDNNIECNIDRRHDLKRRITQTSPVGDPIEAGPVKPRGGAVERALEDDCKSPGCAECDYRIRDAFEAGGREDAEVEVENGEF